jgi:hypothetical protein
MCRNARSASTLNIEETCRQVAHSATGSSTLPRTRTQSSSGKRRENVLDKSSAGALLATGFVIETLEEQDVSGVHQLSSSN